MSWAHPFVAVLAPVAIIAAWWIVRRIGGVAGPAFANIHRRWADRSGLSDNAAASRRQRLRGICLALGAAAALLALARPQWGEIPEQSYERSRDVMLALDLSRSMLADDVTPNRLARAKMLIEALLDQLRGERVGLTVFAGTAFVQSPLSADYEVLRDFLGELDPSYLPQGGTNYTAMLRAALDGFAQPGDGDRFLVVLSDGEALDQEWQQLLPALRERGIRVIGLGIGTPAGALVPDADGGLVKNEQGAAVLSRLEPRTLQALAGETDGAYRDAATWVDIAELVAATVDQGRQGEYVEQRSVRLQDRFQWFLAPALLLLLLSYWLDFPVSPLARALPTRGRRPHPASAPAIAAALMALAAWHAPRLASAAVPDTPPPQSGTASQPNALTTTVAELSAKPALDVPDYARLATETIAFASQPDAPTSGTRAGIIDDALAGVDRGAALDPHAADWPGLRAQLEQLKQVPEPPPQPPQNEQQQQDQPQENGANDEQNQQNQQGGGGGEPNQSGEHGQPQPSEQAQGDDSGEPQHAEAGQPPDDTSAKGDGQETDDDTRPPSGQPAGGHARPHSSEVDQAPADEAASGGGEVEPQDDVQPLAERDAGLGEQESEEQPADEQSAEPAAEQQAQVPQKPASRVIGGGAAMQEHHGETAMAEAVGALERVRDGDSPAVLFDRMNRAEGQPRAAQHDKNW